MWLKEPMDECWEGSLEIRKEGNHWFEGREEFLEEALNLASKDWLDLVRKKVGGGDGHFR